MWVEFHLPYVFGKLWLRGFLGVMSTFVRKGKNHVKNERQFLNWVNFRDDANLYYLSTTSLLSKKGYTKCLLIIPFIFCAEWFFNKCIYFLKNVAMWCDIFQNRFCDNIAGQKILKSPCQKNSWNHISQFHEKNF